MAKRMIHLVYPQNLIKEPVVYIVAKKYNVVPNIRRANVTETVGEITLELSGTQENLDKAIRYFEKVGVRVEPVVGNIVE